MKTLVLIVFLLIAIPALVSAQSCLTSADRNCDMNVNLTEVMDYIHFWYRCSSCVMDLFDAFDAFYEKNGTIDESPIFVDVMLEENCPGTYSIQNRSCEGTDGDGYRYPQDAANIANSGEVVYIREGSYTCQEVDGHICNSYNPVLLIHTSGYRLRLDIIQSIQR